MSGPVLRWVPSKFPESEDWFGWPLQPVPIKLSKMAEFKPESANTLMDLGSNESIMHGGPEARRSDNPRASAGQGTPRIVPAVSPVVTAGRRGVPQDIFQQPFTQLFLRATSSFRLSESPIQGRGLFATKPISKGQRLTEYGGELISEGKLKSRLQQDPTAVAHAKTFVSKASFTDSRERGMWTVSFYLENNLLGGMMNDWHGTGRFCNVQHVKIN